ncbi:hypothetical protein DINM_005814 [Dirofilaria immitis]|nr:hypothetical protein [Dirofilaria immitis]
MLTENPSFGYNWTPIVSNGRIAIITLAVGALTQIITASNFNRGILMNWFLLSRFATNPVFPYITYGLHAILLLLRAHTQLFQSMHPQTHVSQNILMASL